MPGPSPSRSASHRMKARGLVGEPQPQQGVEAEGGVADPHVAVVPVALAADLLGQAGGRRRDDRPARLVGQQLEGQRRAVDHLPPAAGVRRPGQPGAPEGRGRVGTAGRVLGRAGGRGRASSASTSRTNSAVSPRCSVPVGGDVAVRRPPGRPWRSARAGRPSPVMSTPPSTSSVVGCSRGRSRAGRPATCRTRGLPAHAGHLADQPLPVVGVVGPQHGHEVVHLDDAVLGEEAGDQDGGVGEVELLGGAGAGRDRSQPPGARRARGRAARRTRWASRTAGAEPVDGAVGADQRAGAQVADQPVVGDRQAVARPESAALRRSRPSRQPPASARPGRGRPAGPTSPARRAAAPAARPAPARRPATAGPPRRSG